MPGLRDDMAIRGGPADYGVRLEERAPAGNPWSGLARSFGRHKDLEAFRAVRDVFLTQAEARFRRFGDNPEAQQFADLIRDNPMSAKMMADQFGGMGRLEGQFSQMEAAQRQSQASSRIAEEYGRGPVAWTDAIRMAEAEGVPEEARRKLIKDFESLESGEAAQKAKRAERPGGITPAQANQDVEITTAYTNLMKRKASKGWSSDEFVKVLGEGSAKNLLGKQKNPEYKVYAAEWNTARQKKFDETAAEYAARIHMMTGLVGMPMPASVGDFIDGEVYDYQGSPHVYDEASGDLVPVGE